jgi:hypothetical protein
MVDVVEIGSVNDEVRYKVTWEGGSAYMQISKTAKAQAKPSPEQRIKDWLRQSTVPKDGTTFIIPGHHFDPHYF